MTDVNMFENEGSTFEEEESNPSLVHDQESDENSVSYVYTTEDTISGEPAEAVKPKKILIQRVFHQPEKHVVEQKLDYVIANTEAEITKHVYGGLFRNKCYTYAPESYCQKHAPDLYEHQDDTLVKLGDKFDSAESFRLYVDGNAKQWKYYLKCADSHRKTGKESYVFQCVFAKQRSKHSKAKGLRKRTTALPRGDCPCRVTLKPVPFDAKDLTVIYVCNHHDHPLTDEYFYKLQHGRRIHPSIKAEVVDLLALDVDREVVKKYFESVTGYSMSFTYFQNMYIRMKKNKLERQFSVEELKELSKKVEKIKEELGMTNEEENIDNDLISDDSVKKDKASQVAEVLHVLKAVSAPKKTPQRLKTRRSQPDSEPMPIKKRQRKQIELAEERILSSPQQQHNRSRLETRLQELKHDRETLQSIKHLQDSVRCETESNPWVMDDILEPSDRTPLGNKAKRARNIQKQSPTAKPIEPEPQSIIIENAQHDVTYVDNQDIVYENEITVMETTEEQCPETESVVSNVDIANENTEIHIDENNVSYCIQYGDSEQVIDQSQQQYVLMLDDVDTLENLPELQIQATEFATVSIVSDNHQKDEAKVPEALEQESTSLPDESNIPNDNLTVQVQPDQIKVINENSDNAQSLDQAVFEVIQTDDKKIFPRKQVVDTVILNKPVNRVKNVNRGSFQEGHKNKLHKTRKSKKTDVITQYFKEKSERSMAEAFKKDLENLSDNECYMIVVKQEESGTESDRDWTGSEEYEYQTTCSTKSKRSDFDTVSHGDSINSDISKFVKVEATEILNKRPQSTDQVTQTTFEDTRKKEYVEESDDADFLEKRVQAEKELLELAKAIGYLKQQKLGLEKDVEHLLATKDDLIEDITKAARLSRRMMK